VLGYINAKRYPHVRLHMQNFRLRSLVQPPEAEIELNSNELELASSPCLSSLRLRYCWLDDGGYANYNEQAVIDMVAGGAPNLQAVYISREANGNGPWFLLAWQRQRRREWRRSMLFPARPIGIRGSLRTLDIYEQNSTKSLMRWSEATDFSKLRELMIHSEVDREALLWLTTSCRFTALEKLALNLEPIDPDGTPEHPSDAIDDLLLSLNPLTSLRLVGFFGPQTISLVLSHHGHQLRYLLLSFTEPLSETDLAQGRADFATVPLLHDLRQSCPLLEELSLCMLRSRGDASEVAIYRAIGQIPSLRKVHLSILCPQPFTWDGTSFEAFVDLCDQDQQIDANSSHLLESAFVNLAMDEKLARSIFRVISTAKPLYAQPLECLELRINPLEGHGDYTTSTLIDILRYIARSWVCSRRLRDDEPHQCYLTEYDTQNILDREEAEEYEELPSLGDSQYAQAFCRVWPKGREGDWKKEWHSFPLRED
jgi:hypothetical protein